jgi:hypothetical protein
LSSDQAGLSGPPGPPGTPTRFLSWQMTDKPYEENRESSTKGIGKSFMLAGFRYRELLSAIATEGDEVQIAGAVESLQVLGHRNSLAPRRAPSNIDVDSVPKSVKHPHKRFHDQFQGRRLAALVWAPRTFFISDGIR